MFLNALEKQNPALIDASIALWQQGMIGPDCYVIDVDQLLANARLLLNCAEQHQIKLYIMGKQFGRNPLLYRMLMASGFDGIVAVDFKEARQLYHHQLPVAHIGHLVQPPLSMLEEILQHRPEVITVFSVEKARQISAIAQRLQLTQNLLLKVCQPDDLLYAGQEGGFAIASLPQVLAEIAALPAVRVVGATHFPCMMFDQASQQTRPTRNMTTLLKAVNVLREQGIEVQQINAPSATSVETLPQLAALGVTHAEPGHALTGTMPANAGGEQPEKVAMLYLSEISHHFMHQSYCFGGGYYRRGHLEHALIVTPQARHHSRVLPIDSSSIDYCLRLDGQYPIGSPVIMSFRSQIFVTRSDVALISGIHSGNAKLVGLYDSLGNSIGGRHG